MHDKSSHESVFITIFISKNFDTGINRPTMLHPHMYQVASRLPRAGLNEVAERWPNSRF